MLATSTAPAKSNPFTAAIVPSTWSPPPGRAAAVALAVPFPGLSENRQGWFSDTRFRTARVYRSASSLLRVGARNPQVHARSGRAIGVTERLAF
jgi:hypothetical protein